MLGRRILRKKLIIFFTKFIFLIKLFLFTFSFFLINFDSNKHLGILTHIENHTCCLYICNGEETYYNDNDKKIHKCKWKDILQTAEHLYI